MVSARALSKLRNDDRGAAYAYRDLLAAGAPPRQLGEDNRAYVARALAEGPFRRFKHPGNLTYTWALDPTAPPMLPSKPFPKAPSAIHFAA